MWSRVKEFTDRLTVGEKSSLEQLDDGPIRRSIPFRHADRLIGLGLAELTMGRLDLTLAGKSVLAEVRGA